MGLIRRVISYQRQNTGARRELKMMVAASQVSDQIDLGQVAWQEARHQIIADNEYAASLALSTARTASQRVTGLGHDIIHNATNPRALIAGIRVRSMGRRMLNDCDRIEINK